MGHTATLYQGDKLLASDGENTNQAHLLDPMMFDLKTAHWTQPLLECLVPKGPAWFAATYQIASEVQGEGQLGEPTPALCHTGAGVNMVISEDKNAEVEVETIIKTV
ncbi:hypothetical protein CGMCC3_g16649 [Colletotrichum fructicola]|uniref:Uncharacterized protein n=1 Tax=Colletotrichum fructicola (strain Nara gc5) TaxID=1213859 RepID=A0A7J6IC10_COLFN|nr:uncharacterized protein CGMCC3_g16649 [Colletotrichum fructicola]KAE9567223.1 hypothetical protein CGMCC3_g16649 [Colletotrichum fructicola]KAF4418590.1 hypothetical protein CFRS1_v015268 [Colletotrichum fructicola]KAF4473669.1 hypothetical protein CGGC5_v017352 [Colletotrichum fructicola Nara gc5]KAF5482893.1 hypothetical protein CGCF413_v015536 [Colletotrichum fructicola]